jgi:ubiquitin C-terminal hydrolase
MSDYSYEECLSWTADANINPRTGRKIKRYKKVFRNLEEDCDQYLNCEDLHLLNNISNSCYMDSVLTVLFAIPNKFITSKILYQELPKNPSKKYLRCDDNKEQDYLRRTFLQKVLRFLVRSMRTSGKIHVCTQLRKYIGRCNPPQPFHEGGQEEAGEFVQFLFDIFGISHTKRERHTYKTNSLAKRIPKSKLLHTHVVKDSKSSNIIMVNSYLLYEYRKKRNISLRTFLKIKMDTGELDEPYIHKGKGYIRSIEYEQLIDAPYLVFWVNRTDPIKNRIIRADIKPPQRIVLKSGRKLSLNGIVCHQGGMHKIGRKVITGGHYVAYYRCISGEWYYYNDLPLTNELVGDEGKYNELISKKDIRRNGVLYFYVQI